jgi:hypothetical protein
MTGLIANDSQQRRTPDEPPQPFSAGLIQTHIDFAAARDMIVGVHGWGDASCGS